MRPLTQFRRACARRCACTSCWENSLKHEVRKRGAPAKNLEQRKPNLRQRQDRQLSDAQRVFVHRYLTHHNASRAYREAFPDALPSTAESEGSRLKADPRIAQEIKGRLQRTLKRYERSADLTLQELAWVAYSNILDAFDEHGALLAIEDMPREVGASIKKIERIEIRGTDSNGNPAVVGHKVKIELVDKLVALRLLGQHYGLLQEKIKLSASADFADLLREARERSTGRRQP